MLRRRWLKVLPILAALVVLPFLIEQQPLSDAQLRQIVANWFGYSVDQLQFEDLGLGGISWFIAVSANDPARTLIESQVQDYRVTLPNGTAYNIAIDRFTGVTYRATSTSYWMDRRLTIDQMLSPDRAIALARQYLQRYYIWADTSNWEIKRFVPEVRNGWWQQVSPMISVGFEPPLQAPQLPEGVEFVNEAIGCSITVDAVSGDFAGFAARYSQIDFPMEPLITSEEAEAIARQYLLGKGMQVNGKGHWVSLMLAPELGTTNARLAYFFSFACPIGDGLYTTAHIGVDAHTGEVVYEEIPEIGF